MINVLEVNVDDLCSGGVFSLVKNVIKNKDSSFHIDIAAIEEFEKKENVEMLSNYGCKVYYIGYKKNKIKKQFVAYKNLKKLIKERKYDCVHIHADVANKLLVSGLAAKNAGAKKVILHSHAAGVDGNHRFIKRIIHYFCRVFLKGIGTDFVACSDLAAEWMFPNMDKENIQIIKNGIDLKKFEYDPGKRSQIRAQLGLSSDIVLGHVGRFAYQKNHDYLIQIVEAIKTIDKSVRLLLIGEGPDESRIRTLVHEKELDDIVIFYGTSTAVNDLFQAMDIFLLPSHFEGLPIVGVEAQASGLPVLFSDQITREAKITEPVEFLKITQDGIQEWVNKVQMYSNYNRYDTYSELKKKGFSIQDTVNDFLKLYQ